MSEPWVAVKAEDITNRWRPLTVPERGIVDTLIRDAQDVLEEDLEALGIIEQPRPASERWERAYKRAVAWAVIRLFKNPEGFLEETVDGYTYRRDRAISAGALYIDPADVDALRPAKQRRRRGGSFSIAPGL